MFRKQIKIFCASGGSEGHNKYDPTAINRAQFEASLKNLNNEQN